MKHLLIYILTIICVAPCFIACDNDEVHILSKGKMEDVLYDYHLAQGMMNLNSPENSHLIESVFNKHGITEEEFDSSLVYYNTRHKDLMGIYSHLKERLEEQEKSIRLQSGSNEMTAALNGSLDTTDIWGGSPLVILRSNELQNKHTFTIKADTSFYHGDRLMMMANADFIRENDEDREANVILCISLRYDDGKTIADTRTIYGPGTQQLQITADPSRNIKQVSGFFYSNSTSHTRSLAVISGIKLIRIHTQKKEESTTAAPDFITADSLSADSSAIDSVKKDVQPQPRQHREHLTPEQLHQSSSSSNKSANIKTAPDRRTPNSIGPRRKIKRAK